MSLRNRKWGESDLDVLERKKDRQQRGFQFQELLRERLNQSRFEAHANPQVTRPRQSDLLAIDDEIHFLIETKWVGRRIDARDIDDLRSRLSRTTGNVIGCIFSMSPYAASAIQSVEQDRQREILLFQPEEIRDIFREKTTVTELIKRKRKAFGIDGKVWFMGQAQKRPNTSRYPFPPSERGIELSGTIIAAIEDRTNLDHVVFTPHTTELGWQTFGGHGVRLHLPLRISSVEELREILLLIHSQLCLSGEGAFTISQLECNWHGFGIENMLSEIAGWKKRYQKAQLKRIHHSEDISYFDQSEAGIVVLTARQGVLNKAHFHQCELDIILPGIPVDTRPLRRICEIERRFTPVFAPLTHESMEYVRFRTPIPLKPLARIVSLVKSREKMVCGVVVENPFKKAKHLIPEGKGKYSSFYRLASPKHLICSLADWHGLEDVASSYHLKHLEVRSVGEVAVIHPVATWVSIVNWKPPAGDLETLSTLLMKPRNRR